MKCDQIYDIDEDKVKDLDYTVGSGIDIDFEKIYISNSKQGNIALQFFSVHIISLSILMDNADLIICIMCRARLT